MGHHGGVFRVAIIAVVSAISTGQPFAEAVTAPANDVSIEQANVQVPSDAPRWFDDQYLSMMHAPLPHRTRNMNGPGLMIPKYETDIDGTGVLGTLNLSGPTAIARNAFFEPLGTNGRACVTCHVPANAFGLSAETARIRYKDSFGLDPLFDPVDGATCPSNVPFNLTAKALIGDQQGQAEPALGGQRGSLAVDSPNSPYYLLLNKGLIRIPLPVPVDAEFTIRVVRDPYNCNTNPLYNTSFNAKTGLSSQIVSVYRRPPMSSNLKFKVSAADNATPPGFPAEDPLTLTPLPTDPRTGSVENGMIMWDGREPTLSSQATDATLGHAQSTSAPTAAQVAEIVAFESNVYSAQVSDRQAGSLTDGGARGGPAPLAAQAAGAFPTKTVPDTINIFDAWSPGKVDGSAMRESIYRGQQIFNTKPFSVTNVAGFNNATLLGLNNQNPQSPQEHCSTCHGQVNAGTDPLPNGAHDIGIGGDTPTFSGVSPARDLPIFRLTCKAGATTPFNGTTVLTNDPGRALITGKCSDIGRFTTPQLRALAARPPYFSDGSAGKLSDVVLFYNTRFSIGLSAQEQSDLVNFLRSL